ncbi:MAG TPA: NAD(P)H-binding protein [Candidatus Nitrosotenuis sp.]|nr:NAD(P)H-binding protein [Candidatus Nitrosotenuis sp.]
MSHFNLRIAIAGANGFVGTNLRKFLSKNKIQVVSLTRKKQKRFRFEKNLVFSDLASKALGARLRGCDAMVHLIGAGMQTVDADYESVNVEQTRKIIDLCKRSKIKKLVYLSGLGVHKSTTSGYFISKLKAERLIAESGLDYTILRASYIVGKDDPLTKNLRNQIKKGTVVIPGSGSYRLQPISVEDVSKVILVCVTNKKLSKKTLDLVGPQTVSFESYVRNFVGNKAKIKKISAEKAYRDALAKPKAAVYGLDDLNIMLGDFTASHTKLEKLCGFKLRPIGLPPS